MIPIPLLIADGCLLKVQTMPTKSQRRTFWALAGATWWLMLLVCWSVLSPPPLSATPGVALVEPALLDTEWVQVSEGAFGMASGGGYSYEEGYEVLVFEDQLYVGMEADDQFGARIWRTRAGVTRPSSQDDWEEVAGSFDNQPYDSNPYAHIYAAPFGNDQRQGGALQNDHIDSLAAFDGMIYASTANGGNSRQGTMLYRSPSGDPLTWTSVITPGFGYINNTNFKDMQVLGGWLCGGTQNITTGAQVWCSEDGTTWEQKNVSGFGDPANQGIWSGYVFQDALYFGVRSVDGPRHKGRLFRTSSLSREGKAQWTEVYDGPVGSSEVGILGDLDGFLYIATYSANGIAIYRSSSGDVGSWSRVSTTGIDGSAVNRGTVVDGATVHQEALYVAVFKTSGGVTVWRTTGTLERGLVDWEQVGASGLGDPRNVYAQLVSFHEDLYAWTTNYATGQQVRRASVAPPPRRLYLPFLVRYW
jgi:hypothetical protein